MIFSTEEKQSTFFRRRRKREIAAISLGVFAYFCYVQFVCRPQSPVVETTFGKVKGSVAKSRSGNKYFSEYLGIPYAKSPVGELRFEPPQRPEAWDGIYYANSYSSQCLQIDVITGFLLGAEDCLYLNVFTPKILKETDDLKLYPVLFWIHGGGFLSGAAELYRPFYLMDEDVVVVTINYRLASLGFLNTGDGVLRGNQGMKDQVMALQWVQENIRNFHGDPDQVTIFGESAGGGASHYHILSPMSKGLFKKVISQSGTVLNSFLHQKNPKLQSISFAKRLNCPTESTQEMVDCLKSMDGKDIVKIHREMTKPSRPILGIFAPSVEAINDENTFLGIPPIDIINSGNFTKVPWMTGVDSGEGLPFATEIFNHDEIVDAGNSNWEEFLPRILLYNSTIYPEAAKTIKDYYIVSKTNPTGILDIEQSFSGLTEIHSARFFFWSAHYCALKHSHVAPVYMYYFNHPSEFGFLKLMRTLRGKHIPVVELVGEILWFYIQKAMGMEIPRGGVSHGEEMLLQFYIPGIPTVHVGSPDYDMSRALIKTWVNFAKSDTLKFKNHIWMPINSKDSILKYMEISSDSKGMIEEPFVGQMKLWEQLNIQ